MFHFNKYAKILFLVVILVILLSASVSASGYDITYVYYEWGSNDDVYMINYEDALSNTWPYKTSLYDRMVTGIEFALADFKTVWVEVEVAGVDDPVIIDYSKAVKANITLTAAVEDSNYHTTRPAPDYELYLDRFNRVSTRTPQPFVFPDWVDEINVFKPTPFSDRWVVDVYIDGTELPGTGNDLDSISDVRILSIDAVAETDNDGKTGLWRVLVDADQKPTVQPGQVRIKIGDTWYY